MVSPLTRSAYTPMFKDETLCRYAINELPQARTAHSPAETTIALAFRTVTRPRVSPPIKPGAGRVPAESG